MKFFHNLNQNKMNKLFVFGLVSTLFFAITANAQDDKHNKDRWEKFRTEKIVFLTDKLELTPAEAQKFWPIYNQLDKERWQAQISRREMETKVKDAKETLSEKEIIKLTRDYAGGMQTEANMIVKYNEEFLKILSPKKVLKLYQVENDFRMHMIKKFRDGERGGSGSGPDKK